MQLARDADAVKEWDRAIEFEKEPDHLRFQVWRSLALARAHSGDYAKTVADAVALSEEKGATDTAVYNAARVCALASGSVKKGTGLAEQYAALAIKLLVKAREAGYFKDGTDIEHVKQDPDLDALRQRDDFKKFLADLEAANKPKDK
jgi:hypothetical protein